MSATIHEGQPLLRAGAPPERAKAAMMMIHGRGASARDILGLADAFDQPDFLYVAPQAAGNTWYPHSFLMPLEMNEPYLSSALRTVGQVVDSLAAQGFGAERVILLGFSQGACLASEYAARNARRYGGIAVLSGGLIGAEGTPREYPGSLDGTPAFFGCSDVDFHIPKERVQESAAIYERLGAAVTLRLYAGMGHTVNDDEIEVVRGMMGNVMRDA